MARSLSLLAGCGKALLESVGKLCMIAHLLGKR